MTEYGNDMQGVLTLMSVQPTPPTPGTTAQTYRPPAPTRWAAGHAPATQVRRIKRN